MGLAPKINILVVDDHPENLVALTAVLADDQYHVVSATSGLEALKWLLEEEFAVIILDVQMPELDGFETARLIRERDKTRHTPIIFLTAINTERTHVTQGYSLGAVDYLFKPFDPDILRAKVASFAELARKTWELEGEIRQRERAEEEIRALNQELEQRVALRTEALRSANQELQNEIAERKRAEEARESLLAALSASEEQYRALADAMPQLVWTADAEGQLDYVNRRWVEYTGLSVEESLGRGWLTVVYPDDVEPLKQRWEQSISGGDVYEMGCRYRRSSDGLYRWHLSRAYPQRDARGKICRWFGTSTDIEDQKRLEDSLHFLAEASRILVQSLGSEDALIRVARLAVPWFADWCAVDLLEDGQLRRLVISHFDTDWEQIAWDLWHRRPPRLDEPLGPAYVLQAGTPVLAEHVSDELLAAISRDVPELTTARKLDVCSYIGVPLFVRGEIIGAFAFVTARSRRRYSERDLEFARDLAYRIGLAVDNARLFREVEEAGRAKDRFLAMLGHELRNPLAPIRNAVAVMRARGLDDSQFEYHREIIDRQAGHLTRLVDDLLDVARISRGKIDLQKKQVDLCRIVRHAAETVTSNLLVSNHTLDVAVPEGPVWLEADPTRLEQIVTNLLMNAIKYTSPGGRIWLQVELAGEPERNNGAGASGSIVTIRVRDTGVGIPPELLPCVFDAFTQADHSPERSQGGLGLGLTVVRHLVELHGGTVAAFSEGRDHGSEFVVHLPILEDAARLPGHDPDCSSPRRLGREPTRAQGRVLVVDDNRDAADTLSDLLRLWGYETRVVHDGEEAVSAASEFRPDVVLLDIGLPGMDGYRVAQRLRELGLLRKECSGSRSNRKGASTATAPVVLVALTGYGQEEDRRRSAEAGFNYHLAKPVDPESLRELLASELSGTPSSL